MSRSPNQNQAHVDALQANENAQAALKSTDKGPSWKNVTNLLITIGLAVGGFIGSECWNALVATQKTVIEHGVKLDYVTETVRNIESDMKDCVTRTEVNEMIRASKPGATLLTTNAPYGKMP
jgi:mannitol-specific phosphotransferase system IIBC component